MWQLRVGGVSRHADSVRERTASLTELFDTAVARAAAVTHDIQIGQGKFRCLIVLGKLSRANIMRFSLIEVGVAHARRGVRNMSCPSAAQHLPKVPGMGAVN